MIHHWGLRASVIVLFAALGFMFFDLHLSTLLQRLAKKMDAPKENVVAEPVVTGSPLEDGVVALEEPLPDPDTPVISEAVLPAVISVIIASEPVDAEVFFDGKIVGRTPVQASLPLDSATHIALSLEGFEPVERVVRPLASDRVGDEVKYSFQLIPRVVPPSLPLPQSAPAQPSVSASPLEKRKTQLTLSLEDDVKDEPKLRRDLPVHKRDRFFTIQLSSRANEKDAAFDAALYQSLGHGAYVCQTEHRSTRYRVRTGFFADRKDAENKARQIRAGGLETSIVFEDGNCPRLVSATPWEKPRTF